MDSVHDLGGKQGYGPIDVGELEVPFKHVWEGRMWGISSCSGSSDWTIDWWRHVREAIDPIDYLTRSYYDSWAQTELAAYVDSGVFTLEEAISGKCQSEAVKAPSPITIEEAVATDKERNANFETEPTNAPKFATGASIVACVNASSHHTRLPAYVRGKHGTVTAHHGCHIFPDLSAKGIEEGQHLYSVAFKAGDLWSDCENADDVIYLDLWETYFEQA
jgi:nitrile hydratase subunit beta